MQAGPLKSAAGVQNVSLSAMLFDETAPKSSGMRVRFEGLVFRSEKDSRFPRSPAHG